MSTLHLSASVIDVTSDWEPLAVLDVQTDTFRKEDSDFVVREVVGTVRGYYPTWFTCVPRWLQPLTDPHTAGVIDACRPRELPVEIGGRIFVSAYGGALRVDEVIYAEDVRLNVEGDRLHLLLATQYDGSKNEYVEELSARRQRAAQRIAAAHTGRFTRNDYRRVFEDKYVPQDPTLDVPHPAEDMTRVLASPQFRAWVNVYAE